MWTKAEEDCQTEGKIWGSVGHLASIESPCEQQFVFSLVNKAAVWLGATDTATEGTFAWLSNNVQVWKDGPVTGVFSNFKSGQPNPLNKETQDCLSLVATTGDWEDVICSKPLPHVCEIAATVGAASLTKAPTTTAKPAGTLDIREIQTLII